MGAWGRHFQMDVLSEGPNITCFLPMKDLVWSLEKSTGLRTAANSLGWCAAATRKSFGTKDSFSGWIYREGLLQCGGWATTGSQLHLAPKPPALLWWMGVNFPASPPDSKAFPSPMMDGVMFCWQHALPMGSMCSLWEVGTHFPPSSDSLSICKTSPLFQARNWLVVVTHMSDRVPNLDLPL